MTCWTQGVVMVRYAIAVALLLSCSPALARTTTAAKTVRLGAGCIGPVSLLAPRLGTCTIAGAQMRIWCPNGDMFERAQDQPHVSLVRSLCNMLQVP
jgi:hypothetical protein